jgi:uncharacterized protein YkwD
VRQGVSGVAGTAALVGLVGSGLEFAHAPSKGTGPLDSGFGFAFGRTSNPPEANARANPLGTPSAAGTPTTRSPRRPSRSRTPTPRATPTTPRPTATRTPTPTRTPKPELPAPAPAPPTPTAPSAADRVLELVNAERAKAGCAPLREEPLLAAAALKHSTDMAERDYFDHISPEGETPWDRARAEGYDQPAAENIARGQATPEEVVEAWMNSADHRANILNCDYKAMGLGVFYGDGGPWWTQMFGFV